MSMKSTPLLVLGFFGLRLLALANGPQAGDFAQPPREHRPETWFHLIGGNVSQAGLTTDLQAVAAAGLQGIQLFHGSGREWPGVTPQIQTLSPQWDGLIRHVAAETERLGLRFTMQNCPGWAMSGGPWITPDRAMRHLIWSRQDVAGGAALALPLARPEPSAEPWRDYREVAVLAFPTPADDDGQALQPLRVTGSDPGLPWADLLAGRPETTVKVPPGETPAWVELTFAQPVTLRSIELPPIELLMTRRNFDPDTRISVQVPHDGGWREVRGYAVPRGNWQDRLPEYPLVLAVPDSPSDRYRLVLANRHPLTISQLRLSSAARTQDWRGQAGYALRSLERQAPPIQAPAAHVAADHIIDLTSHLRADGRLEWTPPPGRWTIVRFGHVNTGAKNKPAPPEATGFECDKFSPAGAEQHFAGYIGRLTAPGGPAAGQLKGMLIDSWECYTQTWTPAMEAEFSTRRGYALRSWLPALAGWVVDDPVRSERFLRDWRATISDLLVQNYFGRLAELARERGLLLSFETAPGDVSPGDILEYQSRADIPMCEFWQPNDPHDGGYETKPVWPTASAAHLYGKRRVAAEAFTAVPLSWDEHPFALKNFADRHFALGVTHLVFHTYTHNPLDRTPGTSFGSRIGSPFIRGQTWWKHMPLFTDYLARCSYLLERGQPVADVLWYLGDDLDHKPRQDTPFPPGYKFDYLNADVLRHRLSVRADGALVNPEGTAWRVLWLARETARRLTPTTLARLKELLAAGATVVGEAPEANPSLVGGAPAEAEFRRLRAELWGEQPGASGDRRIGRGRLRWGGELVAHLSALGLAPDVAGARSATWAHRREGATDIYFVAADRAAPLAANLRFRATGRPEFWDPLTGRTSPAAVFRQDAAGTTIAMDLPAAGSIFVIFRPDSPARSFTRITHEGQPWLDADDTTRLDRAEPFPKFGLTRDVPLQPWISPASPVGQWLDDGNFLAWKEGEYRFGFASGASRTSKVSGTREMNLAADWSLSFPEGWDAPTSLALAVVQPWSGLGEPATRAFSGTATYRHTFQGESPRADERVWLDLGHVANIAEVRLNGRQVGVVWAAPFRLDITPHLQAGANLLEVEVTNTWFNRLVFEESLPVAERKTWTHAAPPANTPLRPAGLIGPVRLRVGKVITLP
jgi:hypothetical protein